MAASELYQALNLKGDVQNIWILDLHEPPTPSDAEYNLKGTLRVVSLTNRPLFDALSYVWGDEAARDSPTIQIGQYQIRITQNCFDALSTINIRYGALSIWVDSICIDQSSTEERSHQVALMGKVYGQADNVIAWLGDESKETLTALWWLREVAEGRRKRDEIGSRHANITKMLKNEWFCRGWTFQELVLARDPVLMTTRSTLKWRTLSKATELWYPNFTRKQQTIEPGPFNMSELRSLVKMWTATSVTKCGPGIWTPLRINFGIALAIYTTQNLLITLVTAPINYRIYLTKIAQHTLTLVLAIRVMFFIHPEFWRMFLVIRTLASIVDFLVLMAARMILYRSLISWGAIARLTRASFCYQKIPCDGIIQALRTRSVRDDKDKSYALYGVLQVLGANLSEPDYTKATDQVLYELTVDLLRLEWKFLTMLVYVEQLEEQPGPSWVPRWSRRTQASWITSKTIDQTTGFSTFRQLQTHGLPLHMICGNSLYVYATYVDKVAFCIGLPDQIEESTRLRSLQALLEWHREMQYYDNSRLTSRSAPLLLSVLTAWWEDNSTTLRGSTELIMLLTGCSKEEALEHGDQIPDAVSKDVSQILDSCQQHCVSLHFLDFLCYQMSNTRRLFITQSGQIGTGALYMRPGDVIYQISGVPVPLVLREQMQPASYKVIGPAAISGGERGFWRLRKMKRIELV